MNSLFVFGQDQLLHGKITNEIDVEGIHIMNHSTRYNTVTDVYGNFSIQVAKLDTLYISSVHYVPERILITAEIYERGLVQITLQGLVNELDEVFLGSKLSGNLETDLKNIKTELPLNFDDVGIPGFKGKGQERIVPLVYALIPTSVNIEAIYKYLSGYYRKLKLQRQWQAENNSVAHIINYYTPQFFTKAYQLPENRIYDFLLFCVETTSLKSDFRNERYPLVLAIFENKSGEYLQRIEHNIPTED